jgi:hypothetical protein
MLLWEPRNLLKTRLYGRQVQRTEGKEDVFSARAEGSGRYLSFLRSHPLLPDLRIVLAVRRLLLGQSRLPSS